MSKGENTHDVPRSMCMQLADYQVFDGLGGPSRVVVWVRVWQAEGNKVFCMQ